MGGASIFFCGLLVVQCLLSGKVAAQGDEESALEEMIGQPEGENSLPVDVIAAGSLDGAQPEGESSLSMDMTMTIPQSEQQAQAVEAVEPAAAADDSSVDEINTTAISSSSSSLATPAMPDVEFQGEGLRSCKLDGTTCQFSSCGEGRKLPKCVIGFASGVTGGARGVAYTVTSPEDNPSRPRPGTFRYGVQLANQRNGGVWITFARSMTISLRDMIWIRSSTTVDGRGVDVTFINKCFVLGGVSNVILHNFEISGVPQTDTVHIFGGSRGIWVDHLTSFDAKLGLVSVVQGSTDVTISNCYLSNRNFNMLLGASDADSLDRNMRVTVFKNWFKDSMQRMPHCRWGYCHVINNLYTNWGYYAIGGRAHAQILSESNAFMPGRRREVTPWFPGAGGLLDQTSVIQSKNDLYLGGSTFHQFGGFGKASSAPKYTNMHRFPPVVAPNRLVKMVQSCSGALVGNKVQRCLYSS